MVGVSCRSEHPHSDAGPAALELGVFLGAESTCMVGLYHARPIVEDFHWGCAAAMSSVTPARWAQASNYPYTAFLLWFEFLFLVELKMVLEIH